MYRQKRLTLAKERLPNIDENEKKAENLRKQREKQNEAWKAEIAKEPLTEYEQFRANYASSRLEEEDIWDEKPRRQNLRSEKYPTDIIRSMEREDDHRRRYLRKEEYPTDRSMNNEAIDWLDGKPVEHIDYGHRTTSASVGDVQVIDWGHSSKKMDTESEVKKSTLVKQTDTIVDDEKDDEDIDDEDKKTFQQFLKWKTSREKEETAKKKPITIGNFIVALVVYKNGGLKLLMKRYS